MTNPLDDTIRSGAAHVDETEQMASGLSAQRHNAQEDIESSTPETALANLSLSMFTQGSSIRVRVGNAHNSSEFYEASYDSADAANNAMLDAGHLHPEAGPGYLSFGGYRYCRQRSPRPRIGGGRPEASRNFHAVNQRRARAARKRTAPTLSRLQLPASMGAVRAPDLSVCSRNGLAWSRGGR
jgi:hypothetical protein